MTRRPIAWSGRPWFARSAASGDAGLRQLQHVRARARRLFQPRPHHLEAAIAADKSVAHALLADIAYNKGKALRRLRRLQRPYRGLWAGRADRRRRAEEARAVRAGRGIRAEIRQGDRARGDRGGRGAAPPAWPRQARKRRNDQARHPALHGAQIWQNRRDRRHDGGVADPLRTDFRLGLRRRLPHLAVRPRDGPLYRGAAAGPDVGAPMFIPFVGAFDRAEAAAARRRDGGLCRFRRPVRRNAGVVRVLFLCPGSRQPALARGVLFRVLSQFPQFAAGLPARRRPYHRDPQPAGLAASARR